MGTRFRVGAWRAHRGAILLALLLGLALALGATHKADAAVGDLTQKSGLEGCVQHELFPGECAKSPSLFDPQDVVVSPDGRNVYVASIEGVIGMASTQRIHLGRGRIAAPAGTWKAIGVPRGDILVDLFDRRGSLRQTYGGRFDNNLRSRQIETSGMRPQGMPSRQAILVGATGLAVRKVKVYIRGGGTKIVRTVRSPADWGVRNRLFAVAFNVRARFRNTLIAATKVEALNARGRVMRTVRGRALHFGNY